ncbi:hypothetical protein AB0F44_28545 [Nocardioides sp. NPDC023903]|uniref:hypothetical protein n=1 Tax=Nocardioides sp. NPDC023903 TaxID=3157195 RepID=UPI0033CDC3B9
MGLLIALLIVVAVIGTVVVTNRRSQARALEKQRADLEPVKQLAFEDVTAFGEELQRLDLDMAGKELDEGANADYQRALDEYETAKRTVDKMTVPDDVKKITTIVEDGRYAIACVEARVAGEPLPKRRPPCFFDPRHGLSVEDVAWAPPGGTTRDVPACALDAERVKVGAEPDTRKVMVGNERVPYWQGGPAYRPYAAGYFGAFSPMDWMFAGLMFSAFGGFDAFGEIGEGMGDAIGGIGEGMGDMFGGIGDGIGDMFDGFDF